MASPKRHCLTNYPWVTLKAVLCPWVKEKKNSGSDSGSSSYDEDWSKFIQKLPESELNRFSNEDKTWIAITLENLRLSVIHRMEISYAHLFNAMLLPELLNNHHKAHGMQDVYKVATNGQGVDETKEKREDLLYPRRLVVEARLFELLPIMLPHWNAAASNTPCPTIQIYLNGLAGLLQSMGSS